MSKKRSYDKDRAGLRRLAAELIDRGAIKERDLDRFARRLSNATSPDEEREVMNDWLRFLTNAMEKDIERRMKHHNARHPGSN
jgi:C4-dicarboxylate-specific signal transduction histidine kinase